MQLQAAIDALEAWGEPAWRADQVRRAVTRELAGSWSDISTLPQRLRTRLASELGFDELGLDATEVARDQTVKARFHTRDGFPLETVLIRHARRFTVCVSSQSGCALGCVFCATGTMGLGRNLSAGEMLDQLLWAARAARSAGARIGNVVMMGMGEPFHNYDASLAFCRTANDPAGFGLGARSIAISTAGWVPGIRRLAQEPLQVRLALSLHAASDDVRRSLMPVARRYPLAELLDACDAYRRLTHRRIYIEYLLLSGLNDADEDAEALAALLLAHLPGGCHVNLIVYNPTASAFVASPPARVQAFRRVLAGTGVTHSLRRSHGADIAAACGQLAVSGAREQRAALRRRA